MHKNEALPCPTRLDPASHPVEAVGTQRVALGYVSMGLRVEARKDTRESTFENLLPLPPENIYLLRRRSTTYLPDEVYLL